MMGAWVRHKDSNVKHAEFKRAHSNRVGRDVVQAHCGKIIPANEIERSTPQTIKCSACVWYVSKGSRRKGILDYESEDESTS